jgi:DNA polymerase, archaea type
MRQVKSTFEMYSQRLKQMKVPLEELVFTKRISKNSSEYRNRNTLESNAIIQLEIEGKSLRAGEILQYIVTDYYYDKKKSSHKTSLIKERIL